MIDASHRHPTARRVAAAAVGGTLLVLGIIMLATPGPGSLVIAAGLGVLGIEFAWPRRWLMRLRRGISRLGRR